MRVPAGRWRLFVLIGVLLAVGAGIGLAWYLRAEGHEEEARENLDAARKALEEKDYGRAATNFLRYLKRHPDDVEALHGAATAISSQPYVDGENLRRAADHLRRALSLRPDLPNGRRELMDLQERTGASQEALDLAMAFLGEDPRDPDALRTASVCHARLGNKEKALEYAILHRSVAPGYPEAHFQVLEAMYVLERPAADLLAASRVEGAEGPWYDLLACLGRLLAGDREKARELALALAEGDLPDEQFTARLVRVLDALGESRASASVLTRAATLFDSPPSLNLLVRRLYEREDYAEIERLMARRNMRFDVPAYGIAVLSLAAQGRYEEARKAMAEVEERREQPIASPWLALLPVYAAAPKERTPTERLVAARTAVKRLPDEPIFCQLLGDAWEAVGERELAIREWLEAARRSAAWGRPALKASRVALLTGNPVAAKDLLELAEKRWSDSPDIEPLRLLIQGELLGRLTSEERDALARDAGESKDQRGVAIQVLALLAEQRTEDATRAVREALQRDPPLPASLLLHLSRIGAALKQEWADECVRRCEEVHPAAAELAMLKAFEAARDGRPEDGRKILEARAERERTAEAEVALAAYLEAVKDPDAAAYWIRVGQSRPDDVAVQIAAAQSRSARTDRAFVDATIDRLKKLTTEDGLRWRHLLGETIAADPNATEKQLAEAAKVLREIVNVAPHLDTVRIVLGTVYVRLQNTAAAIEQFTLVSSGAVVRPIIELDLAHLYLRQGDAAAARTRLDRALSVGRLPAAMVARAAEIAAGLNEAERALSLLELLPAELPDEGGARALMKARLLASLGRDDEARSALAACLADPKLPAVLFAIDFHGSRGRFEEAEGWLAKLSEFDLPAARQAMLEGDYYRSAGRIAEAEAAYLRAVEASPDDSELWRKYLHLLVTNGRSEEAAAALDKGAGGPLSEFASYRPLLRFGISEETTARLVLEWIQNPAESEPLRAAITAAQDLETGRIDAPTCARDVAKLAATHPGRWSIQRFAIVLLARIDDTGEAVRLARRAATTFAEREEARELLARVLLAAGRMSEAVVQAKQWQKTASDPLLADLLLAELLLESGSPGEAKAVLEPHRSSGSTKAMSHPTYVLHLARALLETGAGAAARELLIGRAAELPRIWGPALSFASTRVPAAERAAWIEALAELRPAPNAGERYAIARALLDAGKSAGRPEIVERARESLGDLGIGEKLAPWEYGFRAMFEEAAGAVEPAIAGYRRAVAAEPDFLIAKNNLAMLLATRGDVAEALALARAVVEAKPSVAEFRDTLSFVHRTAGDLKAAIRELTVAASLEPTNLAWKIALVDLCHEAGEIRLANQHKTAVKDAINRGRRVPERSAELWAQVASR